MNHMNRKESRKATLFDKGLVKTALIQSFAMLNPRTMARNPVMFVTEIGAALTTLVWIIDICGGHANILYTTLVTAVLWLTVLFANFAEALAEASPIRAKVGAKIVKPRLSELLFGVNAEFRYPGITRGTLPAHDPRSLNREFASALHEAGVRVLRFPGGMPTHQYFTEGPEAQAKLFRLFPAQSYYYRGMGYPRFPDVLDFCRRNGFELLFEVNTMFFADENGDVWPVSENRYKEQRPELYAESRIGEAAAALGRFIDTLPAPDAIRYWEIGNEEFALMPLREYAAIVTAFTRVIKAKNPGAVITVTGNTWPAALCEALDRSGALDRVDYLSAHYPWGDHFRPEPGGEKDLERFVCGTLHWGVNTKAHLKMLRDAGFDRIRMRTGSSTRPRTVSFSRRTGWRR